MKLLDNAFFGASYTIASFPSLYDMYGKFIAGLDIDALHGQIFADTLDSGEVTDLVGTQADLIDDDIEENILPRFELGMRDANAVMSSTYVVGKSLIESARVKKIADFSAELRFRLLPLVQERWGRHLEWNKHAVVTYADIMRLYFQARMDVDEANYAMAAQDKLWPFTVIDFERACLGALQGARTQKGGGLSRTNKAISGAASGAAIGSLIPGVGPVIGGIAGLAYGLFGG